MASMVQEEINLLILASQGAERHTFSYVIERESVVLIKEDKPHFEGRSEIWTGKSALLIRGTFNINF